MTPKGKKWLEKVWHSLLQDGPSGDLDSDLRVFLLAVRVGKDRVRAEAFLRNAVAHRQETLAELDANLREEGSRIGLADHYVSLRSRATAAILKAEVEAIDSILAAQRARAR